MNDPIKAKIEESPLWIYYEWKSWDRGFTFGYWLGSGVAILGAIIFHFV
jgi:hypothetical protein